MTEKINQYDSQGRSHGNWNVLHENGNLWIRRKYFHGVLHGLNEWYSSDGVLWRSGLFFYGKEKGLWKYQIENSIYRKEYHLTIK
jgi:antitoxin component YwqK of YwqJK toxin-antitoxin module